MPRLECVDVVLVGIGGYGHTYVRALQPLRAEGRARLAGVIDPVAERAPDFAALQAEGVPFWPDFDAWREQGPSTGLVVVASPIQFHCEQSCAALARGFHVLCEKPAAATVSETERMDRARVAADRMLAIGYQWSFSTVTQRIKADILAGRYGAPRRLRTWVSWPRTSAYYDRNTWAGRVHDRDGRVVNDSPVNNATAHYLHNMLYLLGDAADRAAVPRQVTAELYRVNRVENFDTACLRIITAGGVEVLFLTSHGVDELHNPEFVFEFERGNLAYRSDARGIVGTFADGSVCAYGSPDDGLPLKLLLSLDAAREGRTDTLCGLVAAAMHTRVIDALQRLPVHTIPASETARKEVKPGEFQTYKPGLAQTMRACFADGRLFSESGAAWAQPAQSVAL